MITLDRDRRLIELHVSAKELAARKKKWKAPKSRYKDGILAEYARHVSSASLGAVVEQRGPARTNITSPGWAKGVDPSAIVLGLTVDESAALRMNLSNKIAYERDQVTAMQLGIVRSKSGVTSA